MRTLFSLTGRNMKIFFKDKAMFFTSLITPAILLVLYSTFLAKVYNDAFIASVPKGMILPDKLVKGAVGGQLVSSLLAVSCVTVTFCSNMLMVQDKVTGAFRDLTISPLKKSTLSVSYYIGAFITTLIVCLVAAGLGLIYVASVGWYMSVSDVLLMILDVFLLVMFGTALSSIINSFLSTQGQISAVGTIVSSGYGFICGAYMPISQFGTGLQKILMFLPGTYGTSLIRNHAMRGAFEEMKEIGIPDESVKLMMDSVDCNIYFFDHKVGESAMYAVLTVSALILLGIYVLINMLRKKKA